MSREKSENLEKKTTPLKIEQLIDRYDSQADLARDLQKHDSLQQTFGRWSQAVSRWKRGQAEPTSHDIDTIKAATGEDLFAIKVREVFAEYKRKLPKELIQAIEAASNLIADERGELRETPKKPKKKKV